MYLRIISNIFLIIFLSIVQISFVSALPGWMNNINLIIILLIFILSFKGQLYGFWWAVGAGIALELYSFLPFGINLFSLVFAILFANFLLVNFFTNRSLYSYLVLCFLTIFIYELFLYLLNIFVYYFLDSSFVFNINKSLFFDKLSVALVNIFVMIVLFYLFNFISKNFKPVFLIKGSVKK